MKTTLQPGTCSLFFSNATRAACFAWLALCARGGLCAPPGTAATCAPVTFRGHVDSGNSYTHSIAPALDFKLEAVPAGWMVRVLPHGKPRPAHDYAELANPPYRSPTPLLISTDFGFRAQDAIAWNPRNFRYFTSARAAQVAEVAYQALRRDASSPVTASLLPALRETKEATLTIVDAGLSGGTADQSAAAARVALHLEQTAHRIQPEAAPTPLGRLLGLTFQVVLPDVGCKQPHASH